MKPLRVVQILCVVLAAAAAWGQTLEAGEFQLAQNYDAIPIIRVPFHHLIPVDKSNQSNLARCDSPDRPVCDTGMECLGWIEIAFTIAPDGGVENLQTVAKCPDSPLPEEPWDGLRQWKYNPRIRNGVAVPTPTRVRLAYSLGVSS